MGVEIVECPTCGESVRFGLPRGSEILTVTSKAKEDAGEATKIRPLTCPEEHAFAVEFTVD